MPKKITKKAVKLGSAEKVKKVPKAKKLDYSLEVSVNDVVYKGEAKDMKQALADFISSSAFPFAIKTKVLVKYSKGGVERSQFYHVPEARRIFKIISLKDSALELLATKLTNSLA